MLRRSSPSGFVLLVLAIMLLFIPLGAASASNRAVQTLTLLALTLSLCALGGTWLLLRRRGYVGAGSLALSAVAGGLATVWFLRIVPEFAGPQQMPLALRLLLVVVFDTIGLWLFVVAMRRIFPRPSRGIAIAAVALLVIGLFPAPMLLLLPSADALNVINARPQLFAGFSYWTTGTMLLVVPFVALATLPGSWFEHWWRVASARVMAVSNRQFALGLVAVALALTLFFTFYSFAARPTTADEIAQLWHAQMLLEGRLGMPPDPNAEFFAVDNIVDRPLWMSQFPIGGPAVLAVGLLIGAVWLVNPILTALTALNVYRFARQAYDEPHARAAAALFVASPMVLIMGATHMNHTPTAWLLTLSLAALPLWIRATAVGAMYRSAALVGLGVGTAIAIRPLDGVVAGAVIGLLMLAVAARDRARVRSLLVAIAVGAVPIALLLLANWKTTGHPLRFGYEVLWGANHSLGLHDDPTGHPHTPWRAFLLGSKYTAQLNWITTAWPVPLLIVVAIGLVMLRRPKRWDVFLLSLFGAQVLAYAFYWHDGQFVGPRFLFAAVPALLILAARAPFIVAERVRGVWWRIAILVIPVCIGVSWLRSMPPFGVQGIAREFRESRKRLKVDAPPQVSSGLVQNALIFVQEGATTRLLRRLWGLGISRPDAARLIERADACTLLEAVRIEEERPPGVPADTAGRVGRIELAIRPFRRSAANLQLPDLNFRVTDSTSVTPACAGEIARDRRVANTVAYGPMLLENRFDESGRIGGPAIYVMDLGERNEVLRRRFGGRRWYRYEVPRGRADPEPALVPYESIP